MNTSLQLLDQRVNQILNMFSNTLPRQLPIAPRPKTKLTSLPKRANASKLQLAVSYTAFIFFDIQCLSDTA